MSQEATVGATVETVSSVAAAGVVTGAAVGEIFRIAKAQGFALPAVNCVGTNSINATLEAARDVNSPVIVQFSNSGGAFFAGKTLPNDKLQGAVLGCVAAARYIREVAAAYGVPVIVHTDHCAKKHLPWIDGMVEAGERYFEQTGEPLFSSHMIDLSAEPLEENVETCARYHERMSRIGMTLEIELGVTGGEEDGIDNTGVDNSALYTQPEDVDYAYEVLSAISPNFTIAASFGNVHGVYKPGNVKLTPIILKNSQDFIVDKRGTGPKPVSFVFHGGSGSEPEKIEEAISYGVVKMNIDTDTQYAFTRAIADHVLKNYDGVLKIDGEVGVKNAYDPRTYLKLAEAAMAERVCRAARDLRSEGTTLALA